MKQIKFKSTREVITNQRTQVLDYVFLTIKSIVYSPYDGYTCLVTYGTLDKTIETTSINLKCEDVLAYESLITLSESSFSDNFNKLILEVAKIYLDQNPVFGLAAIEWAINEDEYFPSTSV